MKHLIFRTYLVVVMILISCAQLVSQVQVREEPFHKPVFENEYFRILDVWIQPGDTSLFHIHSTPSLFLYLSDTKVCVEEKGKEWFSDVTKTGYSWYRAFETDSIIHRVANCDTVPLHVTDIELLKMYHPQASSPLKHLDQTLLYENERAFAYQLTQDDFKKQITTRGPMVAQVTHGQSVLFHNLKKEVSMNLLPGQYVYIAPETSFYFTSTSAGNTGIVMYEIK